MQTKLLVNDQTTKSKESQNLAVTLRVNFNRPLAAKPSRDLLFINYGLQL